MEQKIFQTLRIAAAMCFIGHGAFGIITKPIWLNYLAVFGIGHTLGYQLMPVIGTADIILGITMLIYPMRITAGWLVMWGIVTALLRPLSGEPFAEFIERAGNYGAPFALLVLAGTDKTLRHWFLRITPPQNITEKTKSQLLWCFRITGFLLLAGHGWLNLLHKKGLIDQYFALGFNNPAGVANFAGYFELVAAFITLVAPVRGIILGFLAWKMSTELFYPHWEIFEWVERGGSYGTLLALWLFLQKKGTGVLHGRLATAG